MPSNFNPGSTAVTKGATIASGDADTTHQFTGSVLITGSLTLNGQEVTAGGGGGGGGIAFDGTTANGVATRKNATTASIESSFTYDGSTNVLSVTGTFNHTGSHYLSGTLTLTGPSTLPLLVMDDSDASAQIGRAHIGYVGSSDFAAFAHQDQATTTAYAISARSTGQTDINAAGSTPITFRISSATKMQLDSNGNLAVGNNYAPGTYKFDVSGSTRLGTATNHTHYITGTLVHTGSSTTFYVPDFTHAAFTISGSDDIAVGDPTDGLYFGVNTGIKAVQIGSDAIVTENKKIWFGSGSLITSPESGVGDTYISYAAGEGRLIISGSDNGIKLSGSINAPEISSGTLAGAGSYIGLNADSQLVLATAGGGGGSPGGSDTQIQFNDGGSSFGGEANYTFDKGSDTVILTGTYIHSGTLNLTTGVDMGGGAQGTVATLNADTGQYTFDASWWSSPGGDSSRFVVSGTTIVTGSRAVGTWPNLEQDGVVFKVEGSAVHDNPDLGYSPVLVCHVTQSANSGDQGYVGIGMKTPKVHLDVRWNPDLDTNTGGGDVVSFGTGINLLSGALYYLNSSGQWASASADATGSGNSQLLAIALGSSVNGGEGDPGGMLIRGWVNTSRFNGSFTPGGAVYIESGSGGGFMTGAAPTASDSYARIVGYGGADPNLVYFNPGTNWVELS